MNVMYKFHIINHCFIKRTFFIQINTRTKYANFSLKYLHTYLNNWKIYKLQQLKKKHSHKYRYIFDLYDTEIL